MKIFELGSGLEGKIILFSFIGVIELEAGHSVLSVRVLLCIMTLIAVVTNGNKSGGIS